jgi:hypothetical protein
MTGGRQWQPAGDEAPHAIPEDAPVLADFFIHYNLAGLTGAQETKNGSTENG